MATRNTPRRNAVRGLSRGELGAEVIDAVDLGQFTTAERRAVAGHWARAASTSRAAAARLARFGRRLHALDAPAALVAQARHAAEDAVAHARVASMFANAFSDEPPQPTRGPSRSARTPNDLATTVRELADDGCVRTTVEVVEAMSAAERATPPLCEVLAEVASDRARESALAWASLAWIVETQGSEAGRLAIEGLDRAIDASRSITERVGVAAPRLGVLPSLDRCAARLRALDEVVTPLRDEIARRAGLGAEAA